MKQRPVPARSTVVLMAGALLASALIAPVAARESKKDLRQSYKYVVGKLSKSGTINALNNPLNWTKLMNVPSGIADGTDDGITSVVGCAEGSFIQDIANDGTATCGTPQAGEGGDITGVTAGAGLTGGGSTGAVSLAVDDTVMQRRLTGGCSFAQEMIGAAADGSITCGSDPYITMSTVPDPNVLANSFTGTTYNALTGAQLQIVLPQTMDIGLQITFSAESACYGGAAASYCGVRILVNGVEAQPTGTGFAFDSTSAGAETSQSWESHSMTRSFYEFQHPANTPITITVEAKTSNAQTSLGLNYWNLSAMLNGID